MTHRISLRGPWSLQVTDRGYAQSTRRFHAPSGLVSVKPPSTASTLGDLTRVYFGWSIRPDMPLDCLRFNDETLTAATVGNGVDGGCEGFCFDRKRGLGTLEVTFLLEPFNELVFVWKDLRLIEPVVAEGYTPSASHPFHFDSWLEILETPR